MISSMAVSDSTQIRVFPAETPEAPVVNDAARAWARPLDGKSSSRVDQRRGRDGQGKSATVEGTSTGMPFDMDVPVAYNIAAVPEGPVGSTVGLLSGSSMPVTAVGQDDDEKANDDARDAVVLMEKIETDRIPCPRLCGATFSPGIGGLAVFSNGSVKKMWGWFGKMDSTLLSDVPGLIGEGLAQSSEQPESALELKVPQKRDFPRTLKDLVEMNAAAKEAQWGEQNDSDGVSADIQALGANFFDEDSEGSSESGDDDSDDLGEGSKLYDSYFGETDRTSMEAQHLNRDVNDQKQSDSKKSADHLSGPSSDMLAPSVNVTYAYHKLSLNEQCIELAKGWKLGSIVSHDMNLFANPEFDASLNTDPSIFALDENRFDQLSPSKRAAGGKSRWFLCFVCLLSL